MKKGCVYGAQYSHFFEECAICQTFGLDYDDFDLKEYVLKEINVNLEK